MRAMMLILDGLGVGAMDDVAPNRPQDRGSNTLVHVAEAVGGLETPLLAALGLGHIQPAPGLPACEAPLASYGRANLAYQGADSYLGHQELMGTIPPASQATLVCDVAAALEAALHAGGHRTRRLFADGAALLVDEAVVVADNLEADAGQNINLTAALAQISFEEALAVGKIVRDVVSVARVIVFGGPALTPDDILAQLERRTDGQAGVNSPALGVYDKKLVIRHLGYGVDPARQVASLLTEMGKRVLLLGKMADLIVCPQAARDPVVPTAGVMAALIDGLRADAFDFAAATVQETDLAGHEGDARRFADVLALADRGLRDLLPLLTAEDLLIISADHGNDPAHSGGKHTRERVPVLIYRPGQPACDIGERAMLADLAATVAAFFAAPPPPDGWVIDPLRFS